MFRTAWITTLLFVAAWIAVDPCTAADYSGDFTVGSYSLLFHGPGSVPDSYGNTKEHFIEFSDLTIQTNNTYSIQMAEASMQRAIFNWAEYGTEKLVYNAYTNISYVGQDSGSGTFTAGANNTVEVETDDGSATLFFNATTNVALLITADENGTDYEEVGLGLVVRKSDTLSDSDVDGTYIRYTIGNGNSGLTPRGWGNVDTLSLEQSTMVFDGSGNFTEQVDEWAAHRVIIETVTTNGSDHYVDSYCVVGTPETNQYSAGGTYAVSPSDGRIAINMPAFSITNQLSPDGNLVVTALAEAGSESAGCYFSVAIKQPESFPTNAVDAVYFGGEIDEEFGWNLPTAGNSHNSIEAGRSYIFLKSDGTFSIRSDYWSIGNTLDNLRFEEPPNGVVSYNQFTTEPHPRGIEFTRGTYSISTKGVVTLFEDDGDVGMAQLSENGQYVVYGFAEGEAGYAERLIGVGLRREAPPAAGGAVVFNADFSMTPTGAVFSAAVPANEVVEILHTSDLLEGEWKSLMTTNTPGGSLQIHDPGAVNEDTRFYFSTFGIW